MNTKKIAYRKERCVLYFKGALFSLFFFLTTLKGVAQERAPVPLDITEEMELNFQDFFFKALSEKAIGNYQKALENLESCNQITPNNVAVFFEFSKNYLELGNPFLAKEYVARALKKEPGNSWMQKHLTKILKKEKQSLGATKNSQKASSLSLKDSLEKGSTSNKIRDVEDVFKTYETAKSYSALKHVLEGSKENATQLLKYSAEGILLFPAQPFVYLMHGKALNLKKEYSKALETLKNGLDFAFEVSIELLFYKELAISYQGLGDEKAAKKYSEKSKKIKN